MKVLIVILWLMGSVILSVGQAQQTTVISNQTVCFITLTERTNNGMTPLTVNATTIAGFQTLGSDTHLTLTSGQKILVYENSNVIQDILSTKCK